MSSETVAITQSSDDANERGSTVTLGNASIQLNSAADWGGLRFAISAASGDTINSATLRLNTTTTARDNPEFPVYGEDVDNARTFTDTDDDISDRTPTTATVNVDETAIGTGAFEIDVTAIVQEITNRAGFGGNVAFMLDRVDTGNYRYDAYDGSGTPAELDVVWSTPSASDFDGAGLLMPGHGRFHYGG